MFPAQEGPRPPRVWAMGGCRSLGSAFCTAGTFLEPEHVAHEHDRRNDLVPVYGREIRQTQNSSTSPEARKCRSSTMRL